MLAAVAERCGGPNVTGSSNAFSHVSPYFRGAIQNATGYVPASPFGDSAGGDASAGSVTLQTELGGKGQKLIIDIHYIRTQRLLMEHCGALGFRNLCLICFSGPWTQFQPRTSICQL